MTDSQGRVWRCHPNQFYAVEITLPSKDEQDQTKNRTLALLDLLPTVECLSPCNVLKCLDGLEIGK